MPFISSNAFRLKFSRELTNFAVGKISIGYHDVDGKFNKINLKT